MGPAFMVHFVASKARQEALVRPPPQHVANVYGLRLVECCQIHSTDSCPKSALLSPVWEIR